MSTISTLPSSNQVPISRLMRFQSMHSHFKAIHMHLVALLRGVFRVRGIRRGSALCLPRLSGFFTGRSLAFRRGRPTLPAQRRSFAVS